MVRAIRIFPSYNFIVPVVLTQKQSPSGLHFNPTSLRTVKNRIYDSSIKAEGTLSLHEHLRFSRWFTLGVNLMPLINKKCDSFIIALNIAE